MEGTAKCEHDALWILAVTSAAIKIPNLLP
jgi:hypothetical protein